jgi:hypothetical protein
MTGNERRDRPLELAGRPTQLADLGQEGAGELGPDPTDTVEGLFDSRALVAADERVTVRP